MKDALRLAILLDREVKKPLFFKSERLGRHVAHVTKLRTISDLEAVAPYLADAYGFAMSEESAR